MTIPGLPLVIVLAVALEPENPFVIGLLLTVNAWAGLARTIRSQVLSLRSESYVEASRIMGVSTPHIIYDDILPNIMPYVLINFMSAARNVIFSSVGLYFLGILPFTTLNWGVMMNLAYKNSALLTLNAAHWLIIPMFVISLLSYGLIMFSQGMDRVFNPRVRARHATTTSDEGVEDTDR
jgi:peptide/nickel transport system permease protein